MLKQEIIKNLKDEGCNNKKIEEILDLYNRRKKESIYKKLTCYRKKVLDSEHKLQKQIDRLDFFLYKVKKEEKENIDDNIN